MMLKRSLGSTTRPGFTLLEVLLASAIAVLLMAGLYVAMEVQLRQAQEAREIVDQSRTVSSLINRLSTDLTPSLSPVLGRTQYSSTGAAPATGGATSGGTTPTTSGSTPSATGGTTPSGTGTTTPAPTDSFSSAMPFQAGVIGTASELTIFVTRVPSPVRTARGAEMTGEGADVPQPSDLRRISYWIAGNGGLARQETPWLTSDDAMNSTDPDYANESKYIIADEVTDITFEYWDGSGWSGSWDGSELSDDLKTPIGPPLAIAVTITLKVPGSTQDEKRFRHVIALPTAPVPVNNEPPPPTETTTPTTP